MCRAFYGSDDYYYYYYMNQMHSMMSLTMMGLTPYPLVRTLFTIFLLVLKIPLVVLLVWGLVFFVPKGVKSKCGIFTFVVFVTIGIESNVGQLAKTIAAQITYFLPNLKLSFMVIVVV